MRTINRIRLIFNVLFLIATVVTVILWVTDSHAFLYAGITALTLKVFEFILRFIN